MTVLIIILVALALLLYLVEAFVMPGFGISGILASACILVADVLIYMEYGGLIAVVALLVSTFLFFLFFWWFGRSRALEKMSLTATISGTAAKKEQLEVNVGDHGIAATRLALVGNAVIKGQCVEVKSSGAFVDEGEPIVVIAVHNAQITVKRLDHPVM